MVGGLKAQQRRSLVQLAVQIVMDGGSGGQRCRLVAAGVWDVVEQAGCGLSHGGAEQSLEDEVAEKQRSRGDKSGGAEEQRRPVESEKAKGADESGRSVVFWIKDELAL